MKRSVGRYAPWDVRHRRRALRFYAEFIKNGDLCFDIGSNVGEKTELFLKLGAKVVSVEPQQTCLRQLDKRFGKNRDVIIVRKAVADTEGFGVLAICEDAPSISTMSDKWRTKSRFSKGHEWEITQEVPITTLDVLISQYGLPAFCKIDTEGFEEAVLKGLTKPIPLISFEFTREFFHDAKRCMDHLLSIGPVKFNFSVGESMRLLFPTWVTPNELYEKLESLEDQLLQGDIYAKFA